MNIKSHIAKVAQATKNWLRPDNMSLKKAIEETVQAGLFSFEDIKFQIRVLKECVDTGQIEAWADHSGLSATRNATGKKVLCLHAGNLPLVGFQDALGTLLAGGDYYGKLSRKDPYLLRSFLEELSTAGLSNELRFTTQLEDFKDLKADKVLFAGSEASVEPVKGELYRLNAVGDQTEFIMRTAKFSIAYITNEDPEVITDLVEAIFRYGGLGCRSVAVVVSPTGLNELKCHFQDYVESFWLKNPQHNKPSPALEYQFAYNKATDRPQAWMNDFLIQESEEFPESDFCMNWVKGGEGKVKELRSEFGESVQTVYTSGEKITGLKTEFLSQAQRPPLWWKPDGIGVIESIL